MIEYIFFCGTEIATLKVDDNKNLFIKDKLTNFEYLPLTQKLYRDREKRNKFKIMMSKIPKLTKEELDVYIVYEMHNIGYNLKTKIENDIRTNC